MYIITASRMISGEVLKYLNGFIIQGGYEAHPGDSRQFALTLPVIKLISKQRLWENADGIDLGDVSLGDQDLSEIKVPVVIKKNGSEKVIILPGSHKDEPDGGPNANLIRCVVRAHDWVRKIQSGELGSVREIVEQTGMNHKYVARMLKVAFLAPEITEAILDGKQPPKLTVIDILKPFPVIWAEQRRHFGFA